MPHVPQPDTLPSLVETMRAWAADSRLSASVRAGISRSSSFPFPIDLRRVDNHSLSTRLSPQPSASQRCYMRAVQPLPPTLIVHQCALAYMSDWSLLETALLPHGVHSYQNGPQQRLQMASLDHSMYFHADVRADHWLLYEMHSSWAGAGRGLVDGRFFDSQGRLVVSVMQEGLVRLKLGKELSRGGEEGQRAAGEDSTGQGEAEAGGGSQSSGSRQEAADSGHERPSNHFTVLPSLSKL